MRIPRKLSPSERIAITMGRKRGDRDPRDVHCYVGELYRFERSDHRFTAAIVESNRRKNSK